MLLALTPTQMKMCLHGGTSVTERREVSSVHSDKTH